MSGRRHVGGREARFRCEVAVRSSGGVIALFHALRPPAVMGKVHVAGSSWDEAVHTQQSVTHLLVFESAVMMGLSSFFLRFFPFVSDEASDFALLIAAFAPLDAMSSLGGEQTAAWPAARFQVLSRLRCAVCWRGCTAAFRGVALSPETGGWARWN